MSRVSFKSIACSSLAGLACVACGQRYTTLNDNGVWWLVGPDHEKIFSLGVCVVDPGVSWDDYSLNNLAYAGFRFYPTRDAWAKDAVSNLTKWGFNTIGAWSDYGRLLEVPGNHLYMTPILHMGSASGAIWSDMWDPAIVNLMDEVARGQIEARKKDPRVIGYFSDNEQGWWKGSVFKLVWEHKTHGTRDRAVELLKKHYNNDWSKLTADFEVDGASSFVQLMDQGILYLKPGSQGVSAASEILQMIADRYYSLCRDIIKKYDPDALYLGDRYISNYYPEVAAEAGKYCDVVSTNLNPDWKDGGFVRFHLDSLEALTHKPLMVTEYYMTAKENGTGDPNNSSDFPVVQTQAERAQGFTNTTTQIASNPELVGAHWFQYYDEPEHGRGDGENYDFGLVDANNKPYELLTQAARNLNLPQVHATAKSPQISTTMPPTPVDPYDMTKWDRNQAFISPADPVARGDLYASWSPNSLELALCWHEDLQSESFYKNGKIPDEDRTIVEIDIPASKLTWRFRVNGKDSSILAGPDWDTALKANTSTHQTLWVQIPPHLFGMRSFKAGYEVRFKVRLISETKAYTTHWDATRHLAQ